MRSDLAINEREMIAAWLEQQCDDVETSTEPDMVSRIVLTSLRKAAESIRRGEYRAPRKTWTRK